MNNGKKSVTAVACEIVWVGPAYAVNHLPRGTEITVEYDPAEFYTVEASIRQALFDRYGFRAHLFKWHLK